MSYLDVDLMDPKTFEIIIDSISDGVFTVDHEWRIMTFNKAAESITGIPRQKAIGRPCHQIFRSNMCKDNCALKKTMKEGRPFSITSAYIISADQKKIPISLSTSLLKDSQGRVKGGVEIFRDYSQIEELRKHIYEDYKMGDIIANSAAMIKIFQLLPQIAQSDSTVLISGETGTGKGLLARAIHNLSARKKGPYWALNCGALPDTLLESELFGYKAGAFTHAVKDKPGFFALADQGSILLDEIGDTSPAFQVRLLKVIETKEFQPLGGIKKEKSDVRIIAATNKDLSTLVMDEKFRQDLFYRINVVDIHLPPLRQRMEDLPLLTDHFIHKLNRIRGKRVRGISQDALAILMTHEFPGNVRELENIIEHAFVLCDQGNILPDHLPAHLVRHSRKALDHLASKDPLKAAEVEVILAVLQKNHYDRQAAARDLGIHKTTLFRKIEKLGIVLPKIDGRHRRKTDLI
ncbi:MAG: sigma 54-interacting transcriptional regulator [Desulfobacter sp.]|nr:sigma 54-interacting transcriptional regulator [Desulfobacter sp.]WDP87378.1 MAG: sigma 54-interacting transcriptional regulator [Desulfobacter sp.]